MKNLQNDEANWHRTFIFFPPVTTRSKAANALQDIRLSKQKGKQCFWEFQVASWWHFTFMIWITEPAVWAFLTLSRGCYSNSGSLIVMCIIMVAPASLKSPFSHLEQSKTQQTDSEREDYTFRAVGDTLSCSKPPQKEL